MLNIFSDEQNPFYRSTEFLTLQKLDQDVYSAFIKECFNASGIDIEEDAIEYILDWTRGHTYFTQRLCHTVFNMAKEKVTIELVKEAAVQILQSDSIVFGQYQQMLTSGQWNLLIAVAKEGMVSQITARSFLRKHHLGNPSSVKRSADALIDKNLLDDTIIDGEIVYSLNDVYLSRWLEEKY